MPTHTHQFVETYQGFLGFGLNRETDENTVMVYLQKLADDRLAKVLVQRMSDSQLEALFNDISALLHRHLAEEEYHDLFLRDKK